MKKGVLLVDEDENELSCFLEILKNVKGSFKCHYAGSGKHAIEMLQHTAPDFIFIDYDLSEIDALQVLSAIRFQPKLRATNVYLYTDTISDDDSKMAKMLGATGCIEMTGQQSDLIHKFKAIFSPELLPSYVFLKNNQSQFSCFNAAFLLNKDDENEMAQDIPLQTNNLRELAYNNFYNELSGGTM